MRAAPAAAAADLSQPGVRPGRTQTLGKMRSSLARRVSSTLSSDVWRRSATPTSTPRCCTCSGVAAISAAEMCLMGQKVGLWQHKHRSDGLLAVTEPGAFLTFSRTRGPLPSPPMIKRFLSREHGTSTWSSPLLKTPVTLCQQKTELLHEASAPVQLLQKLPGGRQLAEDPLGPSTHGPGPSGLDPCVQVDPAPQVGRLDSDRRSVITRYDTYV